MSYGTRQKNKKLFGVGVNDANYPVYKNGVLICPFYKTWKKMLERVYYKSCHEKQPTYSDTSIVSSWLNLSEFTTWMAYEDWWGKELDKDLLGYGKTYGPDHCCFILDKTNNFLKEPKFEGRNDRLPIGVTSGGKGRYRATIRDFTINGTKYLGTFGSAREAHLAWLSRKRELALILAEEESDLRVKKALRERYMEPRI